jgi:peptide/nickel transport system substrate-binding protein
VARRLHRPTRGAWTAAAIVLAVAGCGGNGRNAQDPSATGDPGPDGGGARAGTVTIAAAQGVGRLDPYKLLFQYEAVMRPVLWSALTRYTADGGEAVQPDLAASWKASADLTSYTFRLRPGLKFSDGKSIRAKEVVASLRRALDPKIKLVDVQTLPPIEKVTATGERTVRIDLQRASRVLPLGLTKIAIEDVSSLATINRDPVVSGPFKVARFVPDQSLELVPNPNYYGARPSVGRIVIQKAQDNTAAVTALRAGDIQVLWSVPWTDVRALEGSPDVAITTGSRPIQNVIIMMDNTSGVFKDVRARQAMAYALDRPAVLKAVYGGHGLVPISNQPVPAWSELVNKDLSPYRFDLQKAKRLFAEAGVKPGTTFTFWTTAGQYTEWATIKSNEISQWVAKFGPAGKTWPNTLVPNVYGGYPVPINLDLWNGICECNFHNKAYTTATGDADSTADDAKRLALYGDAQRLLHDEVPVVNVVTTSVPIAARASVRGLWIDPTGLARFESVRAAG